MDTLLLPNGNKITGVSRLLREKVISDQPDKEITYKHFIRLGVDDEGVEIFMHKPTKMFVHCFDRMMIFKDVIPAEYIRELD